MGRDIPQEYLKLPQTDLAIPPEQRDAVSRYLTQFMTPRRYERIEQVLGLRTRHITAVLENLHKAHNGSAVIRSCDSFGVQDLHIIDDYQQFAVKRTAASGSHQWITQYRYVERTANNREVCLNRLREQGYKIAATSLRAGAIPLHELPIEQPIALCFGTEMDGLTDDLHDAADLWVQVPLVGFVDSLNISVAAAICLHDLTSRLRRSDVAWRLTADEQRDLRLQWLMNVIDHSEALVAKFFET